MKFFKYHGTGNDFVVVEAPEGRPDWATPDGVRRICDRHFGVGADGVLLIETGRQTRWFMRVLNADGSEAEMCGNGIRCVARHVRERLDEPADVFDIETLAGVKRCRVLPGPDGRVEAVAVSLGRPRVFESDGSFFEPAGPAVVRVPALGREFDGLQVDMGNPHFVVFEGLDVESATRYGSVLSTSPQFPAGANVEFAIPDGPDRFRVVVYERGCGITLACGTGAGATATAAVVTGRAHAGRPIAIELPGGRLDLTVAPDLSDVLLQGPATLVFTGSI